MYAQVEVCAGGEVAEIWADIKLALGLALRPRKGHTPNLCVPGDPRETTGPSTDPLTAFFFSLLPQACHVSFDDFTLMMLNHFDAKAPEVKFLMDGARRERPDSKGGSHSRE